MSLTRTIDAMIASGCSAEQLAAVVRAHEEAVEQAAVAKRAKATAKKRAQRESEKAARDVLSLSPTVPGTNRDIEGQTGTYGDGEGQQGTGPSPKERSPTPPKEITPSRSSLRSVRDHGREDDPNFVRFWTAFPKREGSNPKDPAARKFRTLVGLGVDPEAIIAGAEAYARSVIGSEPRYIAQAATWLNQARWRDEHRAPSPPARAGPRHDDEPGLLTRLAMRRHREPDFPQSDDEQFTTIDHDDFPRH